MCIASSPKIPDPAPPPPLPKAPKPVNADVQKARGEERQRARFAAGRESTIRTGALGLTAPPVLGRKQFFGQ